MCDTTNNDKHDKQTNNDVIHTQIDMMSCRSEIGNDTHLDKSMQNRMPDIRVNSWPIRMILVSLESPCQCLFGGVCCDVNFRSHGCQMVDFKIPDFAGTLFRLFWHTM